MTKVLRPSTKNEQIGTHMSKQTDDIRSADSIHSVEESRKKSLKYEGQKSPNLAKLFTGKKVFFLRTVLFQRQTGKSVIV